MAKDLDPGDPGVWVGDGLDSDMTGAFGGEGGVSTVAAGGSLHLLVGHKRRREAEGVLRSPHIRRLHHEGLLCLFGKPPKRPRYAAGCPTSALTCEQSLDDPSNTWAGQIDDSEPAVVNEEVGGAISDKGVVDEVAIAPREALEVARAAWEEHRRRLQQQHDTRRSGRPERVTPHNAGSTDAAIPLVVPRLARRQEWKRRRAARRDGQQEPLAGGWRDLPVGEQQGVREGAWQPPVGTGQQGLQSGGQQELQGGGQQQLPSGGQQPKQSGGQQWIQVGGQQELQAGVQQERQAGGQQERQVGGQQERQVGGQQERQVGGQQERQAGGQQALATAMEAEPQVAGQQEPRSRGQQQLPSGEQQWLQAGGQQELQAGEQQALVMEMEPKLPGEGQLLARQKQAADVEMAELSRVVEMPREERQELQTGGRRELPVRGQREVANSDAVRQASRTRARGRGGSRRSCKSQGRIGSGAAAQQAEGQPGAPGAPQGEQQAGGQSRAPGAPQGEQQAGGQSRAPGAPQGEQPAGGQSRVPGAPQREQRAGGQLRVPGAPQGEQQAGRQLRVPGAPQGEQQAEGQPGVLGAPQGEQQAGGQLRVPGAPQGEQQAGGQPGVTGTPQGEQQAGGKLGAAGAPQREQQPGGQPGVPGAPQGEQQAGGQQELPGGQQALAAEMEVEQGVGEQQELQAGGQQELQELEVEMEEPQEEARGELPVCMQEGSQTDNQPESQAGRQGCYEGNQPLPGSVQQGLPTSESQELQVQNQQRVTSPGGTGQAEGSRARRRRGRRQGGQRDGGQPGATRAPQGEQQPGGQPEVTGAPQRAKQPGGQPGLTGAPMGAQQPGGQPGLTGAPLGAQQPGGQPGVTRAPQGEQQAGGQPGMTGTPQGDQQAEGQLGLAGAPQREQQPGVTRSPQGEQQPGGQRRVTGAPLGEQQPGGQSRVTGAPVGEQQPGGQPGMTGAPQGGQTGVTRAPQREQQAGGQPGLTGSPQGEQQPGGQPRVTGAPQGAEQPGGQPGVTGAPQGAQQSGGQPGVTRAPQGEQQPGGQPGVTGAPQGAQQSGGQPEVTQTPQGEQQARGPPGATGAPQREQQAGGQPGVTGAPQGAQQSGGQPGVTQAPQGEKQAWGQPVATGASQREQQPGGQPGVTKAPQGSQRPGGQPGVIGGSQGEQRPGGESMDDLERVAEAERRAQALGSISSLVETDTQERPTPRDFGDEAWAGVTSWEWEAFFSLEAVGGRTVGPGGAVPPKPGIGQKALIIERLEIFWEGRWRELFDSAMAAARPAVRPLAYTCSDQDPDAIRLSWCRARCKVGEWSRGLACLTAGELARPSEAMVQSLQEKHPASTSEVPQWVRDFTVDVPQRPPLTTDVLARAIHTSARALAAGPLGWVTEHLRDTFLTEPSCLPHLLEVFNQWVAGQVPERARPWLAASNLVGLSKPNGDVRPVAIGEVLPLILARVFCISLPPAMASYFLQCNQLGAGTRVGVEILTHSFRSALTTHPDWCALQIDVANAFNSFHRHAMFEGLRESPFSGLIPFLRVFYGTPSYLYLRAGPFVQSLESARGSRQRDPLDPFLFAFTQQQVMESRLESEAFGVLRERLEWVGLEVQAHKCRFWEREGGDAERALPLGMQRVEEGLTVVGTPIGEEDWEVA
ncbi:unnamed protein product [Closterium sp. NIES-64]|nr:unnamed protein product [Closterium sp. NIES-64]